MLSISRDTLDSRDDTEALWHTARIVGLWLLALLLLPPTGLLWQFIS